VSGKGAGATTGFTLIELIVVLAIITTLLGVAAPSYFKSLQTANEAVLKENLAVTRDALQKYYADKGKYPDSLEDLAQEKYLRKLPMDPITGSAYTWIVVPPQEHFEGSVYDLHSGAPGAGADGTAYRQW
jgi:general secretion pathway protein G